jgi:hypothetical protein
MKQSRHQIDHQTVQTDRKGPKEQKNASPSFPENSKNQKYRRQSNNRSAEGALFRDARPPITSYIAWDCKESDDTNGKESRYREQREPLKKNSP